MYTVLLVVQVMVAIALVIVILIQRSSNDGLGGLGGGSGPIGRSGNRTQRQVILWTNREESGRFDADFRAMMAVDG